MNNCVFVLGYDGYIGNAITQRLLKEGYIVVGIDNYIKRKLVSETKKVNSHSAIEYLDKTLKIEEFKKSNNFFEFDFDLSDKQIYETIKTLLFEFKPHSIINLAHNPSAAFSMISVEQSYYVLQNNILGLNNLAWAIKEQDPSIHLINLGTMGEFDHAANVTVPEGYFNIEIDGRQSKEMMFPRRPGSIYHSSKVAMSYILDFLTRAWDLKCTDIMQAVVYGMYTDEIDKSKIYSPLHIDEAFGTVLNRFILQAKLDLPLTVYGEGNHSRGFLSLNDSVQALLIAVKNPPESSKVRVWNQLSDWHSMNYLAEKVKEIADKKFNKNVIIKHVETPRKEDTSNHYYNLKTDILKGLGYKPTRSIEDEIEYIFNILDDNYIKDLKNNLLDPQIKFIR